MFPRRRCQVQLASWYCLPFLCSRSIRAEKSGRTLLSSEDVSQPVKIAFPALIFKQSQSQAPTRPLVGRCCLVPRGGQQTLLQQPLSPGACYITAPCRRGPTFESMAFRLLRDLV